MKWVMVLLLSLFGILLLSEGMELWMVLDDVGSEGMNISFLGIKLIDNAIKERIPSYAFGFTVAAFIPMLLAVNLVIKSKLINQNNQHEV
ncbi:hypothetical protein [Bacillus sp. B15-48]|uniref:hypothetical protein n=1 Tax=Bacillus sp. B15-48 TaxID=1548601 RepID=UPI00193FD292|nr:hypothetical protein [Bacillus sp. B15-48]MBM4761960.1 hypothetical protein [Bacillus sp. B15-48]